MSHRVQRNRIDALLALGLFVGYLALLLGTAGSLGYCRDEGFYFQAADVYWRWFVLLGTDPGRALERSAIDQYWSYNHEHPALMKSLFALSHYLLHQRWHWIAEPGTAYRLPAMVLSALAVTVLFLWGRRLLGRLGGLVGALLFALMPRVFYHAHLACFDVPVAAMWLFTTYAYWRSLEARGIGWAVTTGVLYGLLLNTKHNAWLLPGALVLHLLVTRAPGLSRGLRHGRVVVPAALVFMATLGPLVFYCGWPWIWFDTATRLADYVAFHTGHEYYNMEFLGRTYWKPPMPRLYPWVMTAATVPGITLLLFVLGLGWAAWQELVPALFGRHRQHHLSAPPGRSGLPSRPDTFLLWLVCLLASYAPWLSSKTPIFGGTKHWLTAYPYLALFAALGFERVRARIGSLLGLACYRLERLARLVPGQRVSDLLVATSVLCGPAVMTWHSHPWGLSSYTPLVGGAPGAASLGLNRTFWGYTTGAVTGFLNRHVPYGGSVYLHDTTPASFAMLRSDGRLRSDLEGTLDIHRSSYALYHHEPHMSRVEYQIWVDYGTTAPAELRTFDGVPVVWVYTRPPAP